MREFVRTKILTPTAVVILILVCGAVFWYTAERELRGRSGDSSAPAAVIGRPDDEWGQRVVAVVVTADAASPPPLDRLRAAVKERIGPWAAPRELEVVASIPRTGLGKVRRGEL